MQTNGAKDPEGKTQWILRKNSLNAIEHEVLGTFQLSEQQLIDTANKYMQKLEGNITELYSIIGALSAHINNYIINKSRDNAIENGRMAIQDTKVLKRTLSKEKDL